MYLATAHTIKTTTKFKYMIETVKNNKTKRDKHIKSPTSDGHRGKFYWCSCSTIRKKENLQLSYLLLKSILEIILLETEPFLISVKAIISSYISKSMKKLIILTRSKISLGFTSLWSIKAKKLKVLEWMQTNEQCSVRFHHLL